MTNPQAQSEQAFAVAHTAETVIADGDVLADQGFTEDEIMSLLWLRQWYQHGGSDRVEVVRHLEFLKRLVLQGNIEL